jgi:hypothetical protein
LRDTKESRKEIPTNDAFQSFVGILFRWLAVSRIVIDTNGGTSLFVPLADHGYPIQRSCPLPRKRFDQNF